VDDEDEDETDQGSSASGREADEQSWRALWWESWSHCKEVYWNTYITDCLVWPPLQLINFTFVPVKFQFLYVNVANLAWNTFLSLMANKKHDTIAATPTQTQTQAPALTASVPANASQ
jgi:hypothetical protein